MRLQKEVILSIILMVANCLRKIQTTSANQDLKSCGVQNEMENLCGSYTYRTVKPFLTHFRQLNEELVISGKKDSEINELKESLAQQIQENRKLEHDLSLYQSKIRDKETEYQKENSLKDLIIAELKTQISFNQKAIEILLTQSKPTNNFDQLHKELAEISQKLKVCETQLVTLNINFTKELEATDRRNEERLKLCKNEVAKINKTKDTPIPNSCIPFRHSSGVYKIEISKLGETDVLCDSETVGEGGGWLVIQQRINGKEDFYRDWETYRTGFGSYLGDFFIGLEKLHQLTKDRQQELFIHIKRFNGRVYKVRYNNFKVGSEEEGYKLSSLGEFYSNGEDDSLRYQEGQKFTTYDRENDQWEGGNCAVYCHGGWWYNSCANSNLNGEFSDVEKIRVTNIFWKGYDSLKEVKMLIRPIHN